MTNEPPPPEPDPELARFLESLKDTFVSDVDVAKRRMMAPGASDFDRKTYIRTFFAYVEGMLGGQKDAVISGFNDLPDHTPAEYAMLQEKRYSLTDKGHALARDMFLPLAPNVLFGFRLFLRLMGASYEPDFSDAGWRAFVEAVRIRNRLTHPRSLEESRVTAEDIAVVQAAEAWHDAQSALLARAFQERHSNKATPAPQPKP
jgi:hypothetical protein